LFYVACSRPQLDLQIHTNVRYFDQMNSSLISFEKVKENSQPPNHFEIILGHKDINLNSQKFSRRLIYTLKTGDALVMGGKKFGESFALGLDQENSGNVLLFSKNFVDSKYSKYADKGYNFASSLIEYIVYWFDKEDDKEYLVVLPKMRFEKNMEPK